MDTQETNKGQASRKLPGGHDPVGVEERTTTTTGRPAGNLPSAGGAGDGAVSLFGDSGRTEAGAIAARGTTPGDALTHMHALVARSGDEPFSAEIIAALRAPIDDSIVDVKPNGAIFVSHAHYRDVLDAAFGVGGWALIPLATPRANGTRMLYRGYLKARGRFVSDAIGGCDFVASNNQMSWDDAAEGAKSDCLVRCCKALPMFRECWDKDYADYWKATYADVVPMPGAAKSGKGWRKRRTDRGVNKYLPKHRKMTVDAEDMDADDDIAEFASDAREGDS